MKLPRLRGAFPWRIALLIALVLGIPVLIFGTWFRWELPPLQRYYLRAYWDSSEGSKKAGNETRIQWLFKAAPGQKRQPVIDADVAADGAGSLPVQLSQSALEQGWTRLEKGPPEMVSSAEMEEFLKEYFYGNRSVRQLIVEPLLSGCAALIVLTYIAFMMRRELGAEWRGLCKVVSVSGSAFDSAWDLPPDKSRIGGRIRSYIDRWNGARKHRSNRGDATASTNHRFGVNRIPLAGHVGNEDVLLSTTVRQTELSALQGGKPSSLDSPRMPPQRRSIFPGAASVRTANAEPKPWDESQWID